MNRYGKFRSAIIRRIELRDSIYHSDFRRYPYFGIGCSYLDYHGSDYVTMYLPRSESVGRECEQEAAYFGDRSRWNA